MPPNNETGSRHNELATLGGGCFWCLEAVFLELRGVIRVKSGYSGGHFPNPTYQQVCSGRTGHAEVVQLTFNPSEIDFSDILRVFFTIHDPTTPDRQGADAGTQYRSIILTHSNQQHSTALRVMSEIQETNIWPDPLVTQIRPSEEFYPAEAEHDNYYARNPYAGYCRAVISPKVIKFRKSFTNRLKGVSAT